MKRLMRVLACVSLSTALLSGCGRSSIDYEFNRNGWSYDEVTEFVCEFYGSGDLLYLIEEKLGERDTIGMFLDRYDEEDILEMMVEGYGYDYVQEVLDRVR